MEFGAIVAWMRVIVENHMEKKMENDMETGGMQGYAVS